MYSYFKNKASLSLRPDEVRRVATSYSAIIDECRGHGREITPVAADMTTLVALGRTIPYKLSGFVRNRIPAPEYANFALARDCGTQVDDAWAQIEPMLTLLDNGPLRTINDYKIVVRGLVAALELECSLEDNSKEVAKCAKHLRMWAAPLRKYM